MKPGGFLARVFGGADRAGYLIRNAGPGKPIVTGIQVYVGPRRVASLEQLVAKRKSLAQKLPQFAEGSSKVQSGAKSVRARYGEAAARQYLEDAARKHAELTVMLEGLDAAIARKRREMGI